MNNIGKTLNDTSGRFKTDKHFKNTIIKNCSRLRQRSTDAHYNNRHNTLQPKLNNIRRVNNYKKRNSMKENTIESKEANNVSKNNISIDININIAENKNKRIPRFNIRKAFFNYDTNKKKEKEHNLIEKEKNDTYLEVTNNKDNKQNNNNNENINNNKEVKNNEDVNKNENVNKIEYVINKDDVNNKNDVNNKEDVNNNEDIKNNEILNNNEIFNKNNQYKREKRRNKLMVNKNNFTKNSTNEGIKELIIDIKDNNFSKGNYKRSNSIRRIMNSLYYHSYTAEKKEKINSNICNKKETFNNSNSNSNNNINNNINSNNKILQSHNKNHNSVFNSKIKKENNKIQKSNLNKNTNSSYIYQKKHKKFGNILNSNNLFFNTYSTEDNSFITNTNDDNKEYTKKHNDTNNPDLMKVKIVYRKPNKRSQITNENNNLNNTVSINQTIHRCFKRRKILFEKKLTEENIASKEGSINKNRKIESFMTPTILNSKEKKLIISSKVLNSNINDINNFENNINDNDNDNDNQNNSSNNNYVIDFFDDIIELCNGIEERTIFEILTKNINKKYIIDYNQFVSDNNITDINDNFNYCFKYFCIIIIAFYFLSKDETLYKYNSVKIHLLFIQYIYSSLCYIGYQDLNSKNIKRFFKDYHFKKKVSIIQCTTSIIKLLFDEKEEYNSLNNVLKQLMVNARTMKVCDMTRIINQTILFCFNTKMKGQNMFPFLKQRNSAINNIYNSYITINKEENNKNDEKIPVVPYIKTSMRKKFCLVLDLDETISHSLKLNFGYYFLLRPGVIEFLTELSEFYEIIIFTSSPKIYADNIIDKIDEKGKLISHRLYKPHVVFERGKSVKKLNLIGRDLNKIIFVDNIKSNDKYNPKNLYLIPSWTDDIYDDELFKLKNKLKYIYTSGKFNDDITKAL